LKYRATTTITVKITFIDMAVNAAAEIKQTQYASKAYLILSTVYLRDAKKKF
jgi:hypothetical protein